MLVRSSLFSVPLKEQSAPRQPVQFSSGDGKWPMFAECQYACLLLCLCVFQRVGALVFKEGIDSSPGRCVFKGSV